MTGENATDSIHLERRPSVTSSNGHPTNDQDAEADDGCNPSSGPCDLDFWATLLLTVQHASQSWGYRSAEFAYPIFMVEFFTNTLLPASIYGLVTTAAAILFSNSVGRNIHRYSHTKLRTLRVYIMAQKALVAASYGLFLLLFLDERLKAAASDRGVRGSEVWAVFAAITVLGCGVILSNVGISVGVERECAQIISRGSPARLTRLNAIMRSIDLLSKLLSPLFVSLLTTAISYKGSAIAEDEGKVIQRRLERQSEQSDNPLSAKLVDRVVGHLKSGMVEQYRDWTLFVRMPIFITSVCISLLYMSVLSFDSTFIAYLKSETTDKDAFVAGMRAVGVVAGLLGTILMPWMEKKIGLVRTGSYSLWVELLPLIPAVVSLLVTGTNPPFISDASRRYRPQWKTALSPVHLPPSQAERKNALMSLQFALQNVFDLGHYGLTLGWNRPEQFKYAAAVSLGAVGAATLLYIGVYARRVRGHLVHFERLGLERLIRRKEQ